MPADLQKTNQLLHQYFDKVLVMTVPRFTERHQRVKERMKGIDFEFFYGVDKNDLTPAFISENYHYDKKNSLAVRQYFQPLNTGEIACSLSHRKIYEAMQANGWQRVLIFEDDVVPDPEKLDLLEACLNELPPDWELFYLGYLKNERATTKKKIDRAWYRIMAALGMNHLPGSYFRHWLPKPYSPALRRSGFHDCTHAYAVSLEGARKLAALQTPVIHRADNLLSAAVLKGGINAFISRECLFNQEIFSDKDDRSYIRQPKAKQA